MRGLRRIESVLDSDRPPQSLDLQLADGCNRFEVTIEGDDGGLVMQSYRCHHKIKVSHASSDFLTALTKDCCRCPHSLRSAQTGNRGELRFQERDFVRAC